MTTKPIYLDDAYLKKSSATVINVVKTGDLISVITDSTIFYPEGGGQPSDQGTITGPDGELKVLQVKLNKDLVSHEGKMKGELKVGDEVNLEIDWARRYKNMQVHSAGHVMHEAVKSLIPDVEPIEGQHGRDSYIKYQGQINKILAQRILDKSNALIRQDLQINTQFVTLDELKQRSSWIPSKLPTNKPLRIMWIGEYEPIPDGGTQVKSTSEIGEFTNIEIENTPENTTVRYKIEFTNLANDVDANLSFTSSFNTQKLQNLKNEALAQIIQATDSKEIEELRVHYLGKNGVLSHVAQELPNLAPDVKIEAGRLFNDVKQAISAALLSKQQLPSENKLLQEDLTLPGSAIPVGILHPITAVAREMNEIFQSLGFSVADGPEIESDEYNYDRLNLPKDHPARDLQDSLYIKEPDILLRTQTSSVEAHLLEDHKPPYRFVFPGKAYRYENVSASNHMMFYQYQGLAVGENISLANLKWTLDTFIKKFYGENRKSRFRCKYYPEVEPGVGVDIDCPFCQQKGCVVCKQRGWIEMLGAGMIHPKMLRRVGIDPQKYSGFAWGIGLDRVAMTRYGINDIRALFNGDLVYTL